DRRRRQARRRARPRAVPGARALARARAARPRRAGDRATQGVEYATAAMSRHLKIAAAQLGPLHRADSRSSAVKRLVNLLREAHAMGAKFVVFPELAFTTFFPRWWMEDQAEVDAKFFEKSIPSKETQPLFDEAKKLGIGFYIGYAELTPDRHRYNAAILVSPDGRIVGKYRKVHLPGHADHKPKAAI